MKENKDSSDRYGYQTSGESQTLFWSLHTPRLGRGLAGTLEDLKLDEEPGVVIRLQALEVEMLRREKNYEKWSWLLRVCGFHIHVLALCIWHVPTRCISHFRWAWSICLVSRSRYAIAVRHSSLPFHTLDVMSHHGSIPFCYSFIRIPKNSNQRICID